MNLLLRPTVWWPGWSMPDLLTEDYESLDDDETVIMFVVHDDDRRYWK